MTRDDMIEIVRKLKNAEYPESEGGKMIQLLASITGDRMISDYIFYAKPSLSPEDIVDLALGRKEVEWHRFEP